MWGEGRLPASASVTLVAAAVLIGGCGDDDDSAATSVPELLTADELKAALLTPEEVGPDWRSEDGAEQMDNGGSETLSARCPGGLSFASPTAAAFIDFQPPDPLADNTISEGLLTFRTRKDLDTWTAALESCVGEEWEELEDPVEHVSVETIEVADLGDDRAGFLLHFAHSEDEGPAHDNRWLLVRVGNVLVLVTGDDYELDDPQDEELLAEVLTRAVEKAEDAL